MKRILIIVIALLSIFQTGCKTTKKQEPKPLVYQYVSSIPENQVEYFLPAYSKFKKNQAYYGHSAINFISELNKSYLIPLSSVNQISRHSDFLEYLKISQVISGSLLKYYQHIWSISLKAHIFGYQPEFVGSTEALNIIDHEFKRMNVYENLKKIKQVSKNFFFDKDMQTIPITTQLYSTHIMMIDLILSNASGFSLDSYEKKYQNLSDHFRYLYYQAEIECKP